MHREFQKIESQEINDKCGKLKSVLNKTYNKFYIVLKMTSHKFHLNKQKSHNAEKQEKKYKLQKNL